MDANTQTQTTPKTRPYTPSSNIKNKLTKREITRLVVQFHKLTGEVPKLRHVPHLPFGKKRVVMLFGTWNNMLQTAGLQLNRYEAKIIKCAKCKKEVPRQMKEIRKSKRSFCSSECNASFYTKGRKHTEETKRKISETLKAHRIFKKD
jgi:hypothetical protein